MCTQDSSITGSHSTDIRLWRSSTAHLYILFISCKLLRSYTANYSRVGSFLTKYGTNLNKVANEGKLDPVIGRQEEIERYATYSIRTQFSASYMQLYESWYENGFRALRAIQILGKRTKNNPILIGEPGVGMQTTVDYELLSLLSPSLSYWNWNRQDCDCGRYCQQNRDWTSSRIHEEQNHYLSWSLKHARWCKG